MLGCIFSTKLSTVFHRRKKCFLNGDLEMKFKFYLKKVTGWRPQKQLSMQAADRPIMRAILRSKYFA